MDRGRSGASGGGVLMTTPKHAPRPCDVARWTAILADPWVSLHDLPGRNAQRHAKARARTRLRSWGLDDAGAEIDYAAGMAEARRLAGDGKRLPVGQARVTFG